MDNAALIEANRLALHTPALMVDLDQLEANIARIAQNMLQLQAEN